MGGIPFTDDVNVVEHYKEHAHTIYRRFYSCKTEKFHLNFLMFFFTLAQTIDCVQALEPPLIE